MVRDLCIRLYWGPFARLVQAMPIAWTYALGRFLGRVLFHVAPGRRARFAHAARVALAAPAPGVAGGAEASMNSGDSGDYETAVHAVVRDAFEHFVLTQLETLLFPVFSANTIDEATVVEGRQRLDAALAEGRGVLLVFGHYGANQMIMPALGCRGYAMCQISAPGDALNEKLPDPGSATRQWGRRQRWKHELALPVEHVNIFGSLKQAFRCLRDNRLLGIAADGGGGTQAVPVTFLGRQANFPVGAASLALRTGCVALPCAMDRDPRGRVVVRVEEPLETPAPAAQGGVNAHRDPEAVAAFTRAFAARLERHVRRRPGLYVSFLEFRMAMGPHDPVPLFEEPPAPA